MTEDRAIDSSPDPSLAVDAGALRLRVVPKRLVLLLLFAATMGAAWYLQSRGMLKPDVLIRLPELYPVWAMVIFIGVYAISVVAALPTLPLNLAAGLLWGVFAGGLIATTGAALGAVAAFLAARTLLGQPLARRFDNRYVTLLQQELDAKGWRFIAFLRLNPVFPTGPLNYLLGLTSIRARTYIWSTVAFLIPPSMLVALIGYEMGGFVIKGEIAHVIRTVLAVSGAVSILIGIRYAARFVNQARRNQP